MIKIARFEVDATPPVGSPLCIGNVKPVARIVAPLSARGIVLTGAREPIVLCAVDWVVINGSAHDFWRKSLAEASGTTPRRVSVHTTHPHDAPGHIFAGSELDDLGEISKGMQDTLFCEKTVRDTAAALRASLADSIPITHFGYGKARVRRVASNRRILAKDGGVHMRFSSCPDKALRDEPEGVIDPWLRNLSFWNGEQPVASITYYATHPQSFYNTGAVSPDFVGLARSIREAALPGTFHLHFDGCGGNVAAGKYNDRSPENRLILARRMLKGMEAAWKNTRRFELKDSDVFWRAKSITLPHNPGMIGGRAKHLFDFSGGIAGFDPDPASLRGNEKHYLEFIGSGAAIQERRFAARRLAWMRRRNAGMTHEVSLLELGPLAVLHLPGEMFVEYQLAAQRMRMPAPVLVAAYGDCEDGYIGTAQACREGGYETGQASLVGPGSEEIIMSAIRELLAHRRV